MDQSSLSYTTDRPLDVVAGLAALQITGPPDDYGLSTETTKAQIISCCDELDPRDKSDITVTRFESRLTEWFENHDKMRELHQDLYNTYDSFNRHTNAMLSFAKDAARLALARNKSGAVSSESAGNVHVIPTKLVDETVAGVMPVAITGESMDLIKQLATTFTNEHIDFMSKLTLMTALITQDYPTNTDLSNLRQELVGILSVSIGSSGEVNTAGETETEMISDVSSKLGILQAMVTELEVSRARLENSTTLSEGIVTTLND